MIFTTARSRAFSPLRREARTHSYTFAGKTYSPRYCLPLPPHLDMALRPGGALSHWEKQARGAWQLYFLPLEVEVTMDEYALEGVVESIEVEEGLEKEFCFVKSGAKVFDDTDRGRVARGVPARRCGDDKTGDYEDAITRRVKQDMLIEEVIAEGNARKRQKCRPEPTIRRPRVSFLGVPAIKCLRKRSSVQVALYDASGELFELKAKIVDVQMKDQIMRVLFDVDMGEEGKAVRCWGKLKRMETGCNVILMTKLKMFMNTA